MAAKVVAMRFKPKRSFILRVPPDSKLGQDLLQDASNGPKTIHQLVLEHFLTFLPKSSLDQPNNKVRETLVIMKDVSANLQNRGKRRPLVKLLPKEGIQQKQQTISLCLKAEPEELVVLEDLNVFYSQEECVSLDPAQQPISEKEEGSVGEMKLLVNDINPEGENFQKEFVENEDHREKSLDCNEMDCSMVSEQPPDCHKEDRLDISIPKKRKMRNLLVTIENDAPLEELSKYVDINVIALTRNQRTRRLVMRLRGHMVAESVGEDLVGCQTVPGMKKSTHHVRTKSGSLQDQEGLGGGECSSLLPEGQDTQTRKREAAR
ncbi:hypothetical protein MC885_002610, partial [Smutsia gigantea]